MTGFSRLKRSDAPTSCPMDRCKEVIIVFINAASATYHGPKVKPYGIRIPRLPVQCPHIHLTYFDIAQSGKRPHSMPSAASSAPALYDFIRRADGVGTRTRKVIISHEPRAKERTPQRFGGCCAQPQLARDAPTVTSRPDFGRFSWLGHILSVSQLAGRLPSKHGADLFVMRVRLLPT